MGAQQYQKAVDDFTTAIAHGQTESWIYNNRAYAYGELGRKNDALQDYATVLHTEPSNQDALQGQAWVKSGQ